MNRLNLLHVVLALVGLLILLNVFLSQKKENLEEVKIAYNETLVISKQLNSLNDVYSNKKRVQQSITRLLQQRSLRNAKIKQKITKSGIIFTSKSLSQSEVNSLMSKIINGTYNVYAVKIKKISKDKVSFMMELRW